MISNFLHSLLGGVKASQPGADRDRPVLTTDEGLALKVQATRRGGMGVVYLCSAPQFDDGDGPMLALKTFDEQHFYDAEMQAAVESESRTWLTVTGAPGVLPLLGVYHIDKKPHLVMPAIRPNQAGCVSLADEIRKHPKGLPARRCLGVALQLAMALHECAKIVPGLIHGDIKPDNILLNDDTPMLADFGAARLASQAKSMGAGTAVYLAPEAWNSDGQTVALDVYAVGATLFEMLSGAPPFPIVDGDLDECRRRHAEEQPRFANAHDANSLAGGLQAIALECLAKAPDQRPRDATNLMQRIAQVGDRFDRPAVAAALMALAHQKQLAEPAELVAMRVSALLESGAAEAALQVLAQQPEDLISGRLLLLHGTACSLAGRDEEAISHFDRYLATETDPNRRAEGLNEKGLSLKRLGRLDDAKALYEQAIATAPRERRLQLRGNYAATLIELRDYERARSILTDLTRRNAKSPEAWGLLGDVLWRQGKHEQAINAIGRSIQLAPREGLFHVTLARFLMEGPQDVEGALQSLDLAYALGFHSAEWVTRTLACNILLGRMEDASGLLGALAQDLSEAQTQELLAEALEMTRQIAGGDHEAAEEGREQEGAGEDEPQAGVPTEEAPSAAAPAAQPSSEDDTAAFRARIRAGVQPYLQLRLSDVDESRLFDFYYGTDKPDFAEMFVKAVTQALSQLEGRFEHLRPRAKPYAFAQCPNCRVVMLSQRDEHENYQCQGCEARVDLTPVASSLELERVATSAMAAIGLEVRILEAGVLLVAVVPLADEHRDLVAERFGQADFAGVPSSSAAHQLFAAMAHERGIEIPKDFQVWMKEVGETTTLAEDGTSVELDRLLRDIRRDAGSLTSMSTTLPKAMQATVLGSHDDLLEGLLKAVDEAPANVEAARRAVEAAVRLGRLDDAKKVLVRLRLAFSDDPDCWAAEAVVAAAQERWPEAAERLERVLRVRPRDQPARLVLLRTLLAMGEREKAAVVYQHLQSHGFGLRPPGTAGDGPD